MPEKECIPRMENNPKMKKMKAVTLKNLGIAFIRVSTSLRIFGRALMERRGLSTRSTLRVVRPLLPRSKNSRELNERNLPTDHDHEVDNVEAFSQVAVSVHDETHSADLDQGFESEDCVENEACLF